MGSGASGCSLALSRDAGFLNRVVNDPSVSKWMLVPGPFDLTEAVENPENVFLANEHGGFLFVRDGDVYEVHTQFLPEGRGPKVLEAAKEAACFMFTQTPCLAIRTYVATENKAAESLTLKMGFSPWEDVLVFGKEAKLYMLTLKMWARSLCQ